MNMKRETKNDSLHADWWQPQERTSQINFTQFLWIFLYFHTGLYRNEMQFWCSSMCVHSNLTFHNETVEVLLSTFDCDIPKIVTLEQSICIDPAHSMSLNDNRIQSKVQNAFMPLNKGE